MALTLDTLKSAAQHSSGIAKLYEACETFFNLAKAHMDHVEQQIDVGFQGHDLDLDAMLDEWELGLAGENAREMSLFLMGSGEGLGYISGA